MNLHNTIAFKAFAIVSLMLTSLSFESHSQGITSEAVSDFNQEVVDTSQNVTIYPPELIAEDDSLYHQRVGLVLSGGGAKGIAHVGVIKALEDNDIPIDYVTGTSMGAIVGSLYSCGWSPERMLDFFTTQDFLDWSTGTINKDNTYYYYENRPTPKWVSINVNFGKKTPIPTQIIPTSLISPLPMNVEFLNLYGPYSQLCDKNFNNLFVPFRCVASDVYHKHKVVFAEGSLGDAVRASMSFPLVFRPIQIDGVLMYDGGIYDNFPVNVMREDFKPDFIIGVSVSGADSKPRRGDMYSQIEDMVIQNNDYSLPADLGVKIQVPVLNYGVLQFDKGRTIYEIGYKTGLSMVDSIKSRLKARRPLEEVTQRREIFAAQTPKLMFDSVIVNGLPPSQERYLRYLFNHDSSEPFGMKRTVNAYYRAITDGSLSNLVPSAIFGNDGHNTLVLDATPKRPWTLSVGGWVTTSTNSMLFVSAGYHTMNLNSLDISLSAWLGQAYCAGLLDVKFALRTRIPSYLQFEGVLSKQRYYDTEVVFYKNSSPLFVAEIDNFARVGYVWAIGRRMRGYMRIGGGYISDTFFPSERIETYAEMRDKLQYRVGVVRLGVDANSFDNLMYPSAGRKWYVNVDLSLQSSRFCPKGNKRESAGYSTVGVASLELLWNKYFKLARQWSLGVYANGMVTLQKLNQNYINTLMHATAFQPTPATRNYFNMAFRSDNYVAVGLEPIWSPLRRFQVRGEVYAYVPVRDLKDNGRYAHATYGKWLCRTEYIAELNFVYNLPFASISFYGNYLSSPSKNWNFGLSFGLFFQAPKLLRN